MAYPQKSKNILIETPNEAHPHIVIITINRPQVRNAVDRLTADELVGAFKAFDKDNEAWVAILTGQGGNFCAGADLQAILQRGSQLRNQLSSNMDDNGPMGISRMRLSKPVIAAVSGYAVAVLCRLRGVPLIDGGTFRLSRLIGQSRAMDMILTGRLIQSEESIHIGLATHAAKHGETALRKALEIATLLCSHPQECMRIDRMSALNAWDQDESQFLAREFEPGRVYLEGGGYKEATRKFLFKSRL